MVCGIVSLLIQRIDVPCWTVRTSGKNPSPLIMTLLFRLAGKTVDPPAAGFCPRVVWPKVKPPSNGLKWGVFGAGVAGFLADESFDQPGVFNGVGSCMVGKT